MSVTLKLILPQAFDPIPSKLNLLRASQHHRGAEDAEVAQRVELYLPKALTSFCLRPTPRCVIGGSLLRPINFVQIHR
jgi:hypothetical protein